MTILSIQTQNSKYTNEHKHTFTHFETLHLHLGFTTLDDQFTLIIVKHLISFHQLDLKNWHLFLHYFRNKEFTFLFKGNAMFLTLNWVEKVTNCHVAIDF
jgi:hypothetical protein